MTTSVPVTVFGGPTALIEYVGLRLLTDPTFDAPGDYELGPGLVLTKTAPSATSAEAIGKVDVVLLSHDQHPDNLDNLGRAYLQDVPVVLTTPSGAERLASELGDKVQGLAPWKATQLQGAGGTTVTITSLPAQHGPEGCEPITGEVVGFLLQAEGQPTVYVSGDNASVDIAKSIAERVGTVDVAVIFAGAARTPFFDGALVTVDGALAAEVAQVLSASHVIGVHTDSWAHFTETRTQLNEAFAAAGLGDRLQQD